MINFGKNVDHLAVIADILDDNRVLLDGPTTGVSREVYPIKRLYLTGDKLKILKGATTKVVRYAFSNFTYFYRAAIKQSDIVEKWESTPKGKKAVIRAKRASLNDFDRFCVSSLKKRRAFNLRRKK